MWQESFCSKLTGRCLLLVMNIKPELYGFVCNFSAGCGRTGAIIAIDYAKKLIKAKVCMMLLRLLLETDFSAYCFL